MAKAGRGRKVNSFQTLPELSEEKQEVTPFSKKHTYLMDNAFSVFSVPSDASCLFWAVSLAYLLPVKNNESWFIDRFIKLFDEENRMEAIGVRELIDNYDLSHVYKDETLRMLVNITLRNRVVSEMTTMKEKGPLGVTLNDFLSTKNDKFITEGTFVEEFQKIFPSQTIQLINLNNLKPYSLNESAIDLIEEELDKLLDREKIQKFKSDAYLSAMKSGESWAGEREIRAIKRLLGCQILIFGEENTSFSIKSNFISLCLFVDTQRQYLLGLIKAEIVLDAFKLKDYELAAAYIELGVDKVDFRDDNGDALLHFAASSDNRNDSINKLVWQGADLNLRNNENKTPVEVAQDLKCENSITVFALYTARINETTRDLPLVNRNQHKISVVVIYPNESHDFTHKNVSKTMDDDAKFINAELKNTNISYNESGHSALHVAAEEGNEGIVRLLLSSSSKHPHLPSTLLIAPTNNEKRQTALHLAALNNRVKVVLRLLESGAEVNAKDFNITIKDKDPDNPTFSNWTPLHYAAEKGFLEVVKALVEKGKAEIDIKDFSGGTPLQRAAKFGHSQVVEYLEGKGADVKSKDKTLVCVLSYAAKAEHVHIMKYLMANGAEKDSVDQNGWSPLHHAVKCSRWNAVKCLVEYGTNINMADKSNVMPLSRVVKVGKWDMVKYFLENSAKLPAIDEEKSAIFKNILNKYGGNYQFLPEIELNYAGMLATIRKKLEKRLLQAQHEIPE